MTLVTYEPIIPQGKIQGESNLVALCVASYFPKVCFICPLVLHSHSGLRNIKQFCTNGGFIYSGMKGLWGLPPRIVILDPFCERIEKAPLPS
jgi:hypothetical protein